MEGMGLEPILQAATSCHVGQLVICPSKLSHFTYKEEFYFWRNTLISRSERFSGKKPMEVNTPPQRGDCCLSGGWSLFSWSCSHPSFSSGPRSSLLSWKSQLWGLSLCFRWCWCPVYEGDLKQDVSRGVLYVQTSVWNKHLHLLKKNRSKYERVRWMFAKALKVK